MINRKSLKFKPELAQLIIAGKKYCTWRLFDDKDLKEGDILDLINSDTREKFGEAKLTHANEKKMKDLVEADFDGHEKFSNEDEMYRTYRSYYGDRVAPETIVKVINFEFVPTQKKP